jgi:hypothetical protein
MVAGLTCPRPADVTLFSWLRAALMRESTEGAAPSTVIDTTDSPLKIIIPNCLRVSFVPVSFSEMSVDFRLTCRISSTSHITMFICLSNAKNVPNMTRPSCNVARMRWLRYWYARLDFDVIFQPQSVRV